jgi:hypothetical protein
MCACVYVCVNVCVHMCMYVYECEKERVYLLVFVCVRGGERMWLCVYAYVCSDWVCVCAPHSLGVCVVCPCDCCCAFVSILCTGEHARGHVYVHVCLSL